MIKLYRLLLLIIIIFFLSLSFAAYDDSQPECEEGNYIWLNGEITGDNGPCCGDDLELDTFFNGTINTTAYFCQNGSFINQTIEFNDTVCDYYNYKWFTESCTGNYPYCCGDDADDTFYNGSIGLTKHFCHEAQFFNDKIDRKQELCEYYSYYWMLGKTTDKTYDDDFENFAENDDILTLDPNWNYFIYGPSTDLNFTAFNDSQDVVGKFYDNNADASMYIFREIEPNGKLGDYISFDLKVVTSGTVATYIALMDPSGNAVGILGLVGGYYVAVNNTDMIPVEASGNWDAIEFHSVPYDEGQDPWADPGRWRVKINDNWYPSETGYYEGYQGRYWASEEIGSMLLGTDAFGTPSETAEILIDNVKTSWLSEINYSCCGDDGLFDNFYNGSIKDTENFCQFGSYINQSIDSNETICEQYNYNWISGSLTGLGGACCGDDETIDTFYNSTLLTTNNFCILGEYFSQSLDESETLCNYYNYIWLNGEITGDNGSCCGDDGALDTFYNGSISNTSAFCQAGTPIFESIDKNDELCNYYNYSWINNAVSAIDYSFTNETNGTTDPVGWVCWGSGDPSHCYVVDSAGGRSKVMELFDNDPVPDRDIAFSNAFAESVRPSSGVVSYYFMMKDPDGPTDAFFISQLLRPTGGVVVLAAGQVTAFGIFSKLACIENLGTGLTMVGDIYPDTWHKVAIEFNTSLSTANITLDNNDKVTCGLYDSWNDYSLSNVLFMSGAMLASGTPDHYIWVDDIYFDWMHNRSCCGDDVLNDNFYNATNACIKGEQCFEEINLGFDGIFGTTDDSCGCGNDGLDCLFSQNYFGEKGTCYSASCSSMEQFLPANFELSKVEYENLYSNSISEIKVYVRNAGNGSGVINSVNVSGLSVTSISYNPTLASGQEELITIKAFSPCQVEGIVNNFNFTINYYDGASKTLESSVYEILTNNPLSIDFVSNHVETSFLRLMIDSSERIQYFIKNNGFSAINFSATIAQPNTIFSMIKMYNGEYYPSEVNSMTFNLLGNSQLFFSNQLYPIISGASGQYSKTIQDLSCEHNKVVLTYNFDIYSSSGSGIDVMVADESINMILSIFGLIFILDKFLIKKKSNF